ncbi:MAG: hypothetical protein LBV68_02275 [Spirochaetaceae bacterium]|jgi:hypothetical protein|nr:hypothetical protein [Spirochaetaceae bacterium]
MALDETIKAKLKEATSPLISSVAAELAVAAGVSIIEALVVSNYHDSGLTGDKSVKPTEDEVKLSSAEVAASEKEGKLSHDKISAQDGDISAAATDANAANTEATAADSGATALRTKAGASDIEVKALKMT